MNSLFTAKSLEFPYNYSFPGQGSDEVILYVTREDTVVHHLRLSAVLAVSIIIVLTGWWLGGSLNMFLGLGGAFIFELISVGIGVVFAGVGWWWVGALWQKSLCLITSKRLHKFIYSTPWNRHSLSLPLEMIVDTGAYSKGFLQALLHLGTFTARSSASSSGAATDDPARVNKKYFYIDNVAFAEDLQNYVQKVLFLYRQDWSKLATFRPFIPAAFGSRREEWIKAYPEYWS